MSLRLLLLCLIALLFPTLGAAGAQAEGPVPGQVVVLPGTGLDDLARVDRLGLDVWYDGEDLRVFVPDSRAARALDESGLGWSAALPPEARKLEASAPPLPSGRSEYRYWEDYQRELVGLARSYPDLVRLIQIGKTHERRPILAVEVATDVWADDGRPAFVQYGLTHAREYPSGEMAMEFVRQLVQDRSSARVASLLRRVRTFVVPVLNVDGFVASRGAMPDGLARGWAPGINEYRRKNCRPQRKGALRRPCSSLHNMMSGVDLNRNFSPYWGGAGSAGTRARLDDTYRGPAPLSEPESRALRDLLAGIQPQVVVSLHTHWPEGLWLRPPSFADGRLFPNGNTPDETALRALNKGMAKQTGWLARKETFLYPVTGASTSWSYLNMGSLVSIAEIRGNDFHERFQTMVRGEYPDVWRALLLAAERSASAKTGIWGQAPAGALLRLEKRMRVPNCRGWDEKQNCRQPYRFLNETLSAEIRIPETGLYRWTLLPSSRPLHRGEKWTVTCVQADGPKQQKGFSLTRGQMLRVDWDLCDGPAPALEIVDGLSSRPGEKHVLVARNAPGPVRWDLDDDGSFDDAEGLAITAVFDSAGEHLVRARSGTSEASHSTTIEEPFPTRAWAGAKAWPAFYRSWGDNGKQWMASVTFAALGPDGSTFIWDFDRDGFDDGRGQIVSRSVFFKKTKKIKARVRVTTAGGASAVKTIQRTLRPKHRL